MSGSGEVRMALDADDLEHLLRGGSLSAGGVSVVLQDIGWTEIRRRMVAACSADGQRVGQERTVGRSNFAGRVGG